MAERSKLLQAHYADAVPLDLLRSEQERIARQLASVEQRLEAATASVADVTATLDQALRLLSRCNEANQKATDAERRLLNLGLSSDIWVTDDTATVSLASPFRELMALPIAGEARVQRVTPGAKLDAVAHQASDISKPTLLGSAGLKEATLVRLSETLSNTSGHLNQAAEILSVATSRRRPRSVPVSRVDLRQGRRRGYAPTLDIISQRRLVDLFLTGSTMSAAGRAVGTNPQTARRILNHHGITVPSTGSKT